MRTLFFVGQTVGAEWWGRGPFLPRRPPVIPVFSERWFPEIRSGLVEPRFAIAPQLVGCDSRPAKVDGSSPKADCVSMARITAANAPEMAAKSHAARKQRLASGNLVGEASPQTPKAGSHEAATAYVNARLSRVRVQLDLVDKRITEQAKAKTVDGQVLNWLCAAQERLAEQERILAGRPLPGSRRPKDERARPMTGGWIELQPALPATASPVAQVAPPARPLGWEYDDPPFSVPVVPLSG
jgi:hypothetical protein